jgi:hypothetical protein
MTAITVDGQTGSDIRVRSSPIAKITAGPS